MGNEFITYLQQLEILGFFSGFPLIYAIVAVIKGNTRSPSSIKYRIFKLLPFSYAVTGLLYTGLQLKKFYPHYSIDFIKTEIQIPFYTCWAILSILFFLPVLNKKPLLSLLHSFIFLFLLIKGFYIQLAGTITDSDVIKNYMRVYSDSILLNIVVLASVTVIYYMIKLFWKKISSNT